MHLRVKTTFYYFVVIIVVVALTSSHATNAYYKTKNSSKNWLVIPVIMLKSKRAHKIIKHVPLTKGGENLNKHVHVIDFFCNFSLYTFDCIQNLPKKKGKTNSSLYFHHLRNIEIRPYKYIRSA